MWAEFRKVPTALHSWPQWVTAGTEHCQPGSSPSPVVRVFIKAHYVGMIDCCQIKIRRWFLPQVPNIRSSTLVPDTMLLKLLSFPSECRTQTSSLSQNFLGDRIIFCSNEGTLGGLLDGDGWIQRPSHDQKLDLQPFPHSLEMGEGLEVELRIMKPPYKSLRRRVQRASGWCAGRVLEGWHTPTLRGQKLPWSGPTRISL